MFPTSVPGAGRFRPAKPLQVIDESVTVALTGALTRTSVPTVRLHLISLAAAWGPEEICLNLSGVHAVNAAGAEPLLEAQNLQHERGAVLRLVEISPAVMRFLHREPRFARLLIPPETAGQETPAPPPVDLQEHRKRSRPVATGGTEVRAGRRP